MTPYFKNAPLEVTFVGGDPDALSKVQAIELGIWGNRGLADRLNNALTHRESGIFGFSIQEEVLDLSRRQAAAADQNVLYFRL